jgi:hypothetical protein
MPLSEHETPVRFLGIRTRLVDSGTWNDLRNRQRVLALGLMAVRIPGWTFCQS